MRRLVFLLALAPLLWGCCQLSKNHMMAAYDQFGTCSVVEERRNGEWCIWPKDGGSGDNAQCLEFDQWSDAKALRNARRSIGIPEDICVYCQSGAELCPDDAFRWTLPDSGWGRIKSLYR